MNFRSIFILLVLLSTANACSHTCGRRMADSTVESSPVVDIAGTYSVQGKNLQGASYNGFVVISREHANNYYFRWTISAGELYQGKGELVGNTISVDWGDTDPVIYQVDSTGVLRGVWSKGKATEDLIP